MMTTNNFVKIEDMIINVNSVDVIYEDHSRNYGHGYVVQINGAKYHVDDIQPILNVIGMNTSTSTFDPDKRIDTAPADNFPKTFAKIKAVVDDFNTGRTLSRLTTDVDRDKKTIKIKRSEYSCLIIEDGIITEDGLTTDTYNELKKTINNILIEG